MDLVNLYIRDKFYSYGLNFFLKEKDECYKHIWLSGNKQTSRNDNTERNILVFCFDYFEMFHHEICKLKERFLIIIIIDTPIENDFFSFRGVVVISKYASFDQFHRLISLYCNNKNFFCNQKKIKMKSKLFKTCELLYKRKSVTEIAGIYNVSEKTIHSHKYQFLDIIGLLRRNTLQCVKYSSLLVNLKA